MAALGFGGDERAEVFSCGAILFELLTGAPVYSGSSKTELVRRAKQGPRRVEVGLDGLDAPQALKEVCVRALSPRANDRFQSVAEFAHALGGAGCVAAGTPRGRRAERPWAPFGRERGLEVSQER